MKGGGASSFGEIVFVFLLLLKSIKNGAMLSSRQNCYHFNDHILFQFSRVDPGFFLYNNIPIQIIRFVISTFTPVFFIEISFILPPPPPPAPAGGEAVLQSNLIYHLSRWGGGVV